MFYFRLLTE